MSEERINPFEGTDTPFGNLTEIPPVPEGMEEEEEMTIEEKLAEYEKMLSGILGESKKEFGYVTAGSFHFDAENGDSFDYFRVALGEKDGAEQMMIFNPIFDPNMTIEDVQVGSEVICINSNIVHIVPRELKVEVEIPTFKLVSWNQVGGLKSQIAEIKTAVETPLQNKELAQELGLSAIKGILLYGPPGCGKTYIAKAIASTILGDVEVDHRSFVYLKGGELLSKYVGVTENRIVNTFKSCREYTRETGNPSVIFLDEADAILPKRGSRQSSDVDRTIVPTFLAEMDGFEGDNPIVILSTNLKNSIDSAVVREGRIDLKILIDRPTMEDFEEIMRIHLSNVKVHEPIDDLALFASQNLFENERYETVRKKVSGAMAQTLCKLAIQHTLTRLTEKRNTDKRGVIKEDIACALNQITPDTAKA